MPKNERSAVSYWTSSFAILAEPDGQFRTADILY
jgi:hypothetical protein